MRVGEKVSCELHTLETAGALPAPAPNKSMNEKSDYVELLPEESIAPWWLEDIEDYLELLHGDVNSLCEQRCKKHNYTIKTHTNYNPKSCPGCKTVFHDTKKGGGDYCPFCHELLNFIIV
jgi:hypothetical protein